MLVFHFVEIKKKIVMCYGVIDRNKASVGKFASVTGTKCETCSVGGVNTFGMWCTKWQKIFRIL